MCKQMKFSFIFNDWEDKNDKQIKTNRDPARCSS